MYDSDGKKKSSSGNENIIIGLLGISFAIINIVFAVWGFFVYSYDSYKNSYHGLMFIEGILLLVSLSIMLKKIDYEALCFMPIVTGIITIAIGINYVEGFIFSEDYGATIMYSNLIMGGLLQIITSCIFVTKPNYKIIVFISIIFVSINVIIGFLCLSNQIKYNWLFEAIISGIQIFVQILLVVAFFVKIIKKQNYKFMIFVPIIFGIISILIGTVRMYIKIQRPPYYTENNEVIVLGTIIFGGILLIILLLKIINKLNYKIILTIPIPFGIMNIIYGFYKIIYLFNYPFVWQEYVPVIITIMEGVLFIIISCRSIIKLDNQELIK
jgi:hypothetical protein